MANEQNLTEETAEVVSEEVMENTEAEVETEASENLTEEEADNKELVAVYPILFLSHQYNVGEVLPVNYPDMVQAWLEAGTAVWKQTESPKAMARPATAEPGLPGTAVASDSEDGENLVGKVPKTTSRKKK